MKEVEPKIFHIASTGLDETGLQKLLNEMGCPDWETNADGPEKLIEVAGKFCYKSFSEDLNPNLSKIRKSDNKGYLKNIIESKHFSVIEHATDTYALLNITRVLSHEICRHRLCNFSQESLRFVRLTDLGYYYPNAFKFDDLHELAYALKEKNVSELSSSASAQVRTWESELEEIWESTFKGLENTQQYISDLLHLDELPGNFTIKKKITSAMRRLAPIGLATGIIVTTNHRNWRHIIEMRTSSHAEEEIQMVVKMIAKDLKERYPNIYQDVTIQSGCDSTIRSG